jgi:hypothetical protein
MPSGLLVRESVDRSVVLMLVPKPVLCPAYCSGTTDENPVPVHRSLEGKEQNPGGKPADFALVT